MTAPVNIAPVPQQLNPNQPVQPVPANLLDWRATVEPGGRQLAGGEDELRGYFGAIDEYAAALNTVHNTYQGGEAADRDQQLLLQRTEARFGEQVARRAVLLATERGNPNLTNDQRQELADQCLMEEFSYGIVATARSEARMVEPAVRERGSVVTRTLGGVLGNRWVRRGLYVAAGVGIVGGILSGAAAAVVVGAGAGGLIAPFATRVIGAVQGRGVAHVARDSRNTRAAVEARNNELLQSIELPQPGESYQDYMTRVSDAVSGRAVEGRDQNRTEMGAAMRAGAHRTVGQTFGDIARGMYMGGGFAGLANIDVGNIRDLFTGFDPSAGSEAARAAEAAAAQVKANLIENAVRTGNTEALNSISGYQNYDFTTLDQAAAENGGHFAWNGADNIIPGEGGEAEFLQKGFDATQGLQANGLDVDISKVIQPDGEWHFELNVNEDNGLVVVNKVVENGVVTRTDVLFVPEGGIHGGAQSEFFNALLKGGEAMTYQQALERIGDAVPVSPGSIGAQVGDAAGEAWTIWNGYSLPANAAEGAAGGVVASAVAGENQRRQLPAAVTPAGLAVAALAQNRQNRTQPMMQYLQQARTRAFIQALPEQNQMAYVRMINNMTAMQRAQIARQLQLQQDLIDRLAREDQA